MVNNPPIPSKQQANMFVTRHKNLVSPGKALLDELVGRKVERKELAFKKEKKRNFFQVHLRGSKGHAGDSNWRDINGTIARTNNRIIRRHFFERTQKFLVPLESYFTSLMPIVPSSQSAAGAMPDADRLIRAFDKAEFLKRVSEQQSSILFEGKRRLDLYKKFIHSRTFDLWYFEKMVRTKAFLRAKDEK